MLQSGTDPSVQAQVKRDEATYPVQPYVMAVGSPNSISKMFIVVGDTRLFELPRNASVTNALDLLFKTFFVANLFYPLGWKNVLRFLQVHIYAIPLENPRESTFDEQLLLILNTAL